MTTSEHMERETEVADADFGFVWGRSEGEYFLRNPDGEYKRVTETVVEHLRDRARPDVGPANLRAFLGETAEQDPQAAAILRGLVEDDFVRDGEPVERVRSPDDVRLWPRLVPFVLLLSVVAVAAAVELRSLPAPGSLVDALTPVDAAVLVGLTAVALAAHEYGHYRAAEPYFRAQFSAGTVNAVVPVVKTITTDAWLLPRTVRQWINVAGLFAELAVAVPVLVAHYLLWPDSLALTLFVLVVASHAAFSLNPLYHGDGYWLLADTVGAVNLRSRGVADLRAGRPTLRAAYVVVSYGFAFAVVAASGYVAWIAVGPVAVVPTVVMVAAAHLAAWFDRRNRLGRTLSNRLLRRR